METQGREGKRREGRGGREGRRGEGREGMEKVFLIGSINHF